MNEKVLMPAGVNYLPWLEGDGHLVGIGTTIKDGQSYFLVCFIEFMSRPKISENSRGLLQGVPEGRHDEELESC